MSQLFSRFKLLITIALLLVPLSGLTWPLELPRLELLKTNHVAKSMYNLNIARQPQPEGTAVLFLIDESAGIAGKSKCANVSNTLVLPVDEQKQFRYTFPRFYLALWKTYYASENSGDNWRVGNQKIGQEPISPLPGLKVGVSHFARDYRRLMPLTNIQDIYGEKIDEILSGPDYTLQDKPGDWSCYTYFQSALKEAADDLQATGMTDLQLVLITDGLFRGSESEAPNEAMRANAATELRDITLANTSPNIEVQVLILGKDICTKSGEPSCGSLSDAEYALRQSDWGHWTEWKNEGQLNLLDWKDPIADFALQIKHLLPLSGRFLNIERSDHYSLTTLQGDVGNTHLVIVTTEKQNAQPSIYYREGSENPAPIVSNPVPYSGSSSQVYHVETTLQPVSAIECPHYTSWLRLQPGLIYYWEDSNITQPNLQNFQAIPNQIIVNDHDHDPTLTVSAELDSQSLPTNPNCYQVFLQLGNALPIHLDLPSKLRPQIIQHTFESNNFPDTLEWGDIELRSGIVLKNAEDAPSIGIDPWPLTIRLVYRLSIPLDEVITETLLGPADDPNSVSLTVPIAYAGKLKAYQPDFVPKFGLFPLEPADYFACDPTPVQSPKISVQNVCISPERTEEIAEITEEEIGYDILYHVQFPYRQVRNKSTEENDQGCDYRFLRVQWRDPLTDINRCQWFRITDNSPPTTSTPTPTPIKPNGGVCGATLLILVTLPISTFIRRKRANLS